MRYVLLTALAMGGCGGDGNERTSFEVGSDPTVTVSDTMTDTDSGGTDTGKETKNDEDSDPTGMDTEAGSDTDDDTGSGSETDDPGTTTGLNVVPCVGVDVLFVIDNSIEMADEQAKLVATANAFIDQLVPAVPTAMGDVNIGVITTDAAELVVPVDGMMMPTTYSSGENYMTYSTLMLAPTELTTALTVGEAGSVNERPMDFLIEAISGDVAGNGGFNDGFLREDALLVVVLLTDEEDDVEQPTQYGSAGDPPDWADAVAMVKDGIKRDIAILSIIPTDGSCTDDDSAPRLTEFTESFGHGAVMEVCEPEYATFLIGRIPDLADACTNFAPP